MRLQLGSWIGFLKLQEWHKWRGVRSWLGWLSWTPSNAKWWEFWFVDLDFYYKINLIKRHDACHNTRKYRHLFEQFVSFLKPQQNSRNRDKIWRCWWLPQLTLQKLWFRNLRACGSKRILMPQWEISNLSAHPAYSKNMLWAHNHVISLLSTLLCRKIGHFTAMVTDRTTQVGCEISSFRSRGYNSYLLACNYASTNIIGCSVYKSGRQAQACSLGADSRYPGLCKISEPIDANVGCWKRGATTIKQLLLLDI